MYPKNASSKLCEFISLKEEDDLILTKERPPTLSGPTPKPQISKSPSKLWSFKSKGKEGGRGVVLGRKMDQGEHFLKGFYFVLVLLKVAPVFNLIFLFD